MGKARDDFLVLRWSQVGREWMWAWLVATTPMSSGSSTWGSGPAVFPVVTGAQGRGGPGWRTAQSLGRAQGTDFSSRLLAGRRSTSAWVMSRPGPSAFILGTPCEAV